MRITVFSVVVMAIAVLTACSGWAQQVQSGTGDLQSHRQQWRHAALQDYDVSYQRQCFCLPELQRPILVEVRGGKIRNAVYAEDNGRLAPEIDYDLKTVDDWFALIDTASKLSVAQLRVRYDEVLGYPTSIFIDYHERMADDEITVSDIKVTNRREH